MLFQIHTLLSIFKIQILRFSYIKELYKSIINTFFSFFTIDLEDLKKFFLYEKLKIK